MCYRSVQTASYFGEDDSSSAYEMYMHGGERLVLKGPLWACSA